jgi:hypothetical protein
MTARHVARRPREASSVDDTAFDDALEHIRMLSAQQQSIVSLHRIRRTLLGPPKCAGCQQRWPCPTAQRLRAPRALGERTSTAG